MGFRGEQCRLSKDQQGSETHYDVYSNHFRTCCTPLGSLRLVVTQAINWTFKATSTATVSRKLAQ